MPVSSCRGADGSGVAQRWVDVVGTVYDMAAPKTNAKVAVPKAPGRYGASGQRVLSDSERDKIRRMGASAKPLKVKPPKAS